MKEFCFKVLSFFDRKFFVGFFVYILMAVSAGWLAEAIKARRWFGAWDVLISRYFISLRSDWLTSLMKNITQFGGAEFGGVIVFVILLFLTLKKRYMHAIALTLAVSVSYFASLSVKHIFSRPRPLANPLVPEDGFSFPSSHATVGIALYGILMYFLISHFEKTWQKALVVIFGSALILAIGASRIYLAVHWPSDVIGGYIFGGLWLGIIIWLVRSWRAQEKQMRV